MTRQKSLKSQAQPAKFRSTIYTRQGDFGTTALCTGERLSKRQPRVQVLGALDELNSWLGYVRSLAIDKKVESALTQIQHHLFIIQAMVANPNNVGPKLSQKNVDWLESRCDSLDALLPKLTHFILPGGAPSGAALHVSRTICRRAERALIDLHEVEPVESALLKYLNRLSDFLFILARFENHRAQQPEIAPKY